MMVNSASMNKRFQYRHTMAFYVLTTFLIVQTLEAVDPLPPHIEAASEEERNAYIERLAKDSLKEKIEVGQERYDQRMQFKSETVEQMRSEAQERIRIIRSERENLEISDTETPVASGNTWVYFSCAILLTSMLYFRRRAQSRESNQ